jgi:hypothetical protein
MDLPVTTQTSILFKLTVHGVDAAELYVDSAPLTATVENQWSILVTDQPVKILVKYKSGVPLLRINDFLINFWLADIQHQENCFWFSLDLNFSKKYNEKDKQGRISSLANRSDTVLDKTVGRFLHQDLVDDIKKIIHEKRNIS